MPVYVIRDIGKFGVKEGIVRVKKSFHKPSCVFERIQGSLVCFKSITDNLGVKILKSCGAVEQLHTDLAMALSDGLNGISSFLIKELERCQRR